MGIVVSLWLFPKTKIEKFFLGYFRWNSKIHPKPLLLFLLTIDFPLEMIILVRILFWKKTKVVQKNNYHFLFLVVQSCILYNLVKIIIIKVFLSFQCQSQGSCCHIWTVDNLYHNISSSQNIRYAYLICRIIWFASHYQSALTKIMR